MTLEQTIAAVRPAAEEAKACAWAHWDSIAKPLRSLGLLEEAVVQLAGIQRTPEVCIDRRRVVVFCADNGIVAQGVTQSGQDVTAVVTENIAHGRSSVCRMAQSLGAEVVPVDVGVARELHAEGIVSRRITCGTKDFTVERAMSREQAVRAIEVGIEMAERAKADGIQLLAAGEMGIGNTTTSAAVTAVLLGVDPQTVTGRGSGLTSEGLRRKVQVIRGGIALHHPNPDDVLDVFSAVGGFDLCAMCGLYLGAAANGIGAVLDGIISCAAALCACRLCPAVSDYLIASHRSAEPAGELLLEALGKQPMITAGMALGEGTGAVAAWPLLDLALTVYREMCTFEETDIGVYVPLE
ncbi:MAG: nicotinate-nucleotide--dimethylbenzimidazole phosphoribosyltransferase [Butyricicoccaceae bacterium]